MSNIVLIENMAFTTYDGRKDADKILTAIGCVENNDQVPSGQVDTRQVERPSTRPRSASLEFSGFNTNHYHCIIHRS